jgi:hypothetical protein
MPVLFLLLLPTAAGIIASKYLGRLANFLLMMAVFNFALTCNLLINTGHFSPLLMIPGVGIFPHVGRFSGVSPGGLVYPPLFLLIAIVFNRRRQARRD